MKLCVLANLYAKKPLDEALSILKGLGVGLAGGMALGMVADTVTYGKLKTVFVKDEEELRKIAQPVIDFRNNNY